MSGNPWMKFYPSDWRADQGLRVCSLAARGLWIEMLCVMHNAEPYGHLLINGRPVTDAQLAMLAGTTPNQIPDLLGELELAAVFSRTQKGVIYSRRMTRDFKKAQVARKNGQTGGNPNLCKQTGFPPSDNPPDNGWVNGGDKAQKPESESKKESPQSPPSGGGRGGGDFVHFWEVYPSRGDATNPKHPAQEKFDRLVKSGVNPAVIIAGAEGYAEHCRASGREGTDKVMQAKTFLHQQVYADYSKPRPVPGSGKWACRIEHYRKTGEWDPAWGGQPGLETCQAPADLVAEILKRGTA